MKQSHELQEFFLRRALAEISITEMAQNVKKEMVGRERMSFPLLDVVRLGLPPSKGSTVVDIEHRIFIVKRSNFYIEITEDVVEKIMKMINNGPEDTGLRISRKNNTFTFVKK